MTWDEHATSWSQRIPKTDHCASLLVPNTTAVMNMSDVPGVNRPVVVTLPTKPLHVTKSGKLSDPEAVQVGRPKEMDKCWVHRVYEVKSIDDCNGRGKHYKADWFDKDWKMLPGGTWVVRCMFAATEFNIWQRDDCRHVKCCNGSSEDFDNRKVHWTLGLLSSICPRRYG